MLAAVQMGFVNISTLTELEMKVFLEFIRLSLILFGVLLLFHKFDTWHFMALSEVNFTQGHSSVS